MELSVAEEHRDFGPARTADPSDRVSDGSLSMPLDRSADPATVFARLANERLDAAYGLAGFLLGDAVEAQDALQEALLRAWRAWPSLRDQTAFPAWLDRIVANVCKARLRGRRRFRFAPLDDDSATESADPFGATLARDVVGRALAKLSADQRAVVVLRFWRDMPLEAIAQTLGVPLGTVKSRLHYSLRVMSDEIDDETR
jgi:RNA polymerase sigma-70 factor (ECF subfamily)